jgi:hypothetical protein
MVTIYNPPPNVSLAYPNSQNIMVTDYFAPPRVPLSGLAPPLVAGA